MNLDREHEQFAYLILSPAWNMYKAGIVEKVKILYHQLVNPSQERKDAAPDDYIRGQIEALRWVLEWPEKEMNAATLQALDEQDKKESEKQIIPLFGNGRPVSEDRDGR